MSQTIHRAARRDRFVIVDQSAVEDVRLSWAARGLLAYLLSRPDDWKVFVNDLKRRGNLGRDGIYALLRELRTAGYVRFDRKRDAKGRMRGGTYIVSEIPGPLPALPEVASPDTARPRTAKPGALLKTDLNKIPTTTTRQTITNTGGKPRHCVAPLKFDDGVPSELHSTARKLVSDIHPDAAQLVIDEWAGAMAAGMIQRSPLGYLRTLVSRYQAGEMSVRYARVEPQSLP